MRINHYVQAAPDSTESDPSRLAVVKPSVDRFERRAPGKIDGGLEIHAMFGKIGDSFGFVPYVMHTFYSDPRSGVEVTKLSKTGPALYFTKRGTGPVP